MIIVLNVPAATVLLNHLIWSYALLDVQALQTKAYKYLIYIM